MAGIDPRRSSRARTTGTQSQSQISSTASSLSGRTERNSRLFKTGSPPKSTSTGSLSSEPPEDTITADDTFGNRRRTRGQGEDRERPVTRTEANEMANGDDDLQEEDEAVRCICGYDDYPGPPPFDDDNVKHSVKDTTDIDPIFATDLTDDAAGFFVQCDVCKVWQHGACVGIMTEESSPDEYFCEGCRRDLHKIFTASNGQRYSHYLPLKRPSRATSRSTSLAKDGTRSPPKEEGRSGRTSSANHASKRRSTMNSREAAYDEAEALRRAIEASKEDAPELPEGAPRRAKRGRGDSEEKQENAKRQRTSSRSVSPSLGKNADESDDTAATRNGTSKSKSRTGTSTRPSRTEKPSEREERERQRVEAANKRKGRAERRRADGTAATILVKVSEAHADTDSDPSEELPLAARATAIRTVTTIGTVVAAGAAGGTTTTSTTTSTEAVNPPTIPEPPLQPEPSPDTPPTSVITAKIDKKRSHKKKGRNQYTRDRDGHDEDSPARSQSRDIQREDHAPTGPATKASAAETTHQNNANHSHNHHPPHPHKSHAKAKGGMNSKVTMTDMKRKAGALLDFISRTQVELASEALPETGDVSAKVNGGVATAARRSEKSLDDSAGLVSSGSEIGIGMASRLEKEFKELNCLEMMDSLTRRLVKWQQEYAA
ncbi:hypothetical protein B0H67DRAFT_12192 [Lasiosphaeris hirsuta]|uniref:Zinc finger PHD-type domain-containing protein n=1 Tax=Lasiosphaeris hirsuta TaxID=260670 RepID=A0AA40B916_9PEZI|nr:hypothetical protein B0H67DRAFT_12192 [Lasiosphaeris hirsuta]